MAVSLTGATEAIELKGNTKMAAVLAPLVN